MTKRTQKRGKQRRVNPMTPRSTRPPRNTFAFDGSQLTATIFVPTSATVSSAATDFQQLGCDAGVGITRGMTAMVRQYREYRFKKVAFQFIPNIGPSNADAGSRIYLMYTDNPEQGSAFMNSVAPLDTVPKRTAFVKGSRNVFTFNAWERITWNVPLTYRKKWFDVNTIDPASDTNAFDRAVQGFVGQAYESVSAAVALGTMKITYTIELRGLDVDVGAIV